MKRAFLAGFLSCYALAAFGHGMNAYEIPATTPAGAAYAGVMWAPITLLPHETALAIIPDWAFDFEDETI